MEVNRNSAMVLMKRSFAFLVSVAMLLTGLVGSGLVTTVHAANTEVSDKTLVAKYKPHKVTKAELKKLQSQNWNIKSFKGKYKLKSERSGRPNGGSAFNVDFTSGKLSGIDQAIAYCRMHGAANPKPGSAGYTAKVKKEGKKVRIILDMDPPQSQRAKLKSGSGYQYLGLWLEFEVKEEEGTIRVSKADSRTGSLITGSAAKFNVINSSGKVVETLTTGKIGTATSKKLPTGTYKVQEVGAPTGYKIDVTAARSVKVTDDKVTNITFKDTPKLASVEIEKKFETPNTGDAKLIGAQYTLRAASDIKSPETGKVIWKVGEAISKEEGIGDDGTKTISTPDGKLSWNNLPDGIYKVKETKAPIGAELSPKEATFVISDGKVHGNGKVTMIEDIIPYKAKLIKKDENGKPLAGAKFDVKLESDVKAQGWTRLQSMEHSQATKTENQKSLNFHTDAMS